jgi:hypothetical protein
MAGPAAKVSVQDVCKSSAIFNEHRTQSTQRIAALFERETSLTHPGVVKAIERRV